MRKFYLFICSIICSVGVSVMMSSCTLETSDNGDLDGFWHLVRIDTLDTGGVCDLSKELRFWSVQSGLVNVVDRSNARYGYFLYFDYSGTSLRLYEPYVDNRMSGDPKVEDVSLLSVFGINGIDETFHIDKLSGSRMQLSTDRLRLGFVKM